MGAKARAETIIDPVSQEIADFLDGHSDGARLMKALYGEIGDEEIPPRFKALIERWERRRSGR
jgi:hypothetical protein